MNMPKSSYIFQAYSTRRCTSITYIAHTLPLYPFSNIGFIINGQEDPAVHSLKQCDLLERVASPLTYSCPLTYWSYSCGLFFFLRTSYVEHP